MLLSSLLVGMSALAAGTLAQTSSSASTSSSSKTTTLPTAIEASSVSSSSTAAATHTIAVGASGFKFEPNIITNASVGDIIEYRFYPTGHYVVRSEFKQPCIPYEDTGANKVGFTSGEVNVATTSDNGPRFQVQVNDTSPIFFYCAASGSCTDYHMIGVINPNETQSYEAQLEYAEKATFQMAPGDPFPSETSSSSGSSSTSSSGADSSSHHHGLSAGAIAGIAIGGAAVLVLAAAVVYLCGRRGGLDKAYNRQGRTNNHQQQQEPMVEAQYVAGPKSPGQETFSTTAYTATSSRDPYQPGTFTPGLPGPGGPGLGVSHGVPHSVSSGSPPPMSEYANSLYNHHPQRYGSPLMNAMDGNNSTMQTGYFSMPPQPQQYPGAAHPSSYPGGMMPAAADPVELPTSTDPGNSPLPNYNNSHSNKTFSWANGGEGGYRPSKP